MNAIEIVLGVVLIVISLIAIFVVSLQESKQGNISAIQGGSDSHLDKGRTKTRDVKLNSFTRVLAVIFFVLSFVTAVVVNYFINK